MLKNRNQRPRSKNLIMPLNSYLHILQLRKEKSKNNKERIWNQAFGKRWNLSNGNTLKKRKKKHCFILDLNEKKGGLISLLCKRLDSRRDRTARPQIDANRSSPPGYRRSRTSAFLESWLFKPKRIIDYDFLINSSFFLRDFWGLLRLACKCGCQVWTDSGLWLNRRF